MEKDDNDIYFNKQGSHLNTIKKQNNNINIKENNFLK